MSRNLRLTAITLGIWLAGAVLNPAQAAVYPFSDDFESGLGNWIATGSWGLATAFYASPAHSVTDSPSTLYGASSDTSLEMSSSMDLSGATAPVLAFHHRYEIEDGYDTATVEISTDGGSTWTALGASYSGSQPWWSREQLDLAAFAGFVDVRIRFRLVTDESVQKDGWYIDDVTVGEAPTAVTLFPPSADSPNAVSLSWSASTDAGFTAYRIYRSATTPLDWRTANLVAEITDSATTTYTDVSVNPKSTYHYAIMVMTSRDLHSLSGEQSITTPAGVEYPFLDDAEGTASTWIADAPWAISSEAAFSGSHCWSDSPGGDYANGITSQSLTLVTPVDLSSATTPVLSFVHEWAFSVGDSGNVEVSTDGGSTWTTLATYTYQSLDGWERVRLDLSAYAGSSSVRVRFRITTNATGTADGWHVDDISLAESPSEVDPPILDQVTSHSIRLTWNRCNDTLFSHYAIFRDSTDGVGINSTLVAIVADQDTTTFTDTGLALDTEYFYRVYAVNPYGTFSPDSAWASSARTRRNSLPFVDDFEGSLEAWNLTGSWGSTDSDAHSGSRSLTDSPGTTYAPDSRTEAQTSIDLTGSNWPVLRFWDRAAFASSADWGYLEVFTNSSTWRRVYSITDTRTTWAEQEVDLSPWKNSGDVRIRFVVATNSSGSDDGWYIDDLSITDHSAEVALPFFDGAESGFGDWLHSGWTVSPDTPRTGTACFHATPSRTLPYEAQHALTLDGDLDLSAATDPQLVFWLRGTLRHGGTFAVQVSMNGGVNWSTLPGGRVAEQTIDSWRRYQFSLASYLQRRIRIRFLVYRFSGSSPTTDIFLDDIAIEDTPDSLTLDAPVPHFKSMDLSWTQTTLGTGFARYEVYRATHPNVTPADILVFSSTTDTDTTCTDTGLSPGSTYYYRVFSVDRHEVYSPSGERSATTVPLTLPVYDPMENLDNWGATGSWGPDGTAPHGGSFSLADSPSANYTVSSETFIFTAVDLAGSNWPVLRFWDRAAFADTGDWGYLDVSPDGSTWNRVYTITGTRTSWAEQAVDLSPWKYSNNLRIRFTVATNSSGVDDGWYIDDLSITDHSAEAALPFSDGAESGLGNWLHSGWTVSPDSPRTGSACFRSTPSGILPYEAQHALTLDGDLDLSAAKDPTLGFWLRGTLSYYGVLAVQVSTDGGVSWANLPGGYLIDQTIDSWRWYQFSLAAYLRRNIRIRFLVTTSDNLYGATDIFLDDIAIGDEPDSLTLDTPVPHHKSVDLSWTQTTLGGGFARYEVYRATHPNVTRTDTLVFSSTTDTDTTYTDTGLLIGSTYYYKVFSVDQHEVYSPSNERGTTTVPLTLPVKDPMENLDNWNATGSWGPDGTAPHGGSFSLTDSPSVDYPVNSDTFILTAVDLTGSSWPVLRFWDRAAFADTGDWGYLEVSTDGSTWNRIYTITGTRTTWADQAVDLSPWKNSNNLRIRFTVATDDSGVADGWYIDDLSIEDHSAEAALPFLDGAESGIGNWLHSGWTISPDNPRTGSACFRSTPSGTVLNRSQHALTLDGDLDLSAATDPQLVFWLRGTIGSSGHLYVQASSDGGLTWTTLPGGFIGSRTIASWSRYQLSLASYLQPGVRFRFLVSQSGWHPGATDIFLDDIAIEEAPPAVTLGSPDKITHDSMRLSWNDPGAADFASYRVYRSETSTVDTNSELVATILDPAVTTFTDTGLQARRTYYYRVYLVDTADVFSPSNRASAMTNGIALPFADDFETDSGAWTLTGDWSRQANAGSGDSTGLTDSPGDYAPHTDTWAVTGFDFGGLSWPVLAFSSRYDIESGCWGRVEVSSDGGANWTTVSSAQGTEPSWRRQIVDLSPWRGMNQVWIRFRLTTDGGSDTADGWHIDDIFVGENLLAGTLAYPFFEGGESGMGHWLGGPWVVTGDTPYEGSACLVSTGYGPPLSGSVPALVWGDAIDLSAATEALLTFAIRGHVDYWEYFRVQVSTDGGTNWQDLMDIDPTWSSADWVRMQVPLDAYLVSNLRLRFVVTGYYGSSEIFLDNIGVGPQTPAAPTPSSPAVGSDVTDLYPTLVVNNAVDYQSDPLTYEFEVYDDAALTNLVAQVPMVSQQTGTTPWTVDVQLPTNHQYWWRCRATDDSGHTGPWMETATFFLQVTDHPPTVPVLLGPSNGAELPDLDSRLSWLASTDPEEADGDFVASYRVQVDDDPAFASPEIDEAAIPARTARDAAISVTLGSLAGSGSLVSGTRYYWRVNAKDSQGASSAWSAGPAYFVFGTDGQAPTCTITDPVPGATLTSSPITISGTASDDLSGVETVEVSTDGGATWAPAVGTDSWLYQWNPPSGGDYQLSCRARDVAGNQGPASTPFAVHVDLARTVAYAVDGTWVEESAGAANVTLVLSAPRSEPVTVDVTVEGGTAQEGTDYTSPAQTITFAPGQTAAVFAVTVLDDSAAEPNETVILGLDHPSPSDIAVGAIGTFTLHIVNDDSRGDLDRDGQVTGNDMVVLLLEIFDLDGTATSDVPGSTNPGWEGYDLNADGKVLGSDVAEEILAFHE